MSKYHCGQQLMQIEGFELLISEAVPTIKGNTHSIKYQRR